MPKQKILDFEAALRRLEEIVASLEGENESLEKSLTLFEEGVKLTETLRTVVLTASVDQNRCLFGHFNPTRSTNSIMHCC